MPVDLYAGVRAGGFTGNRFLRGGLPEVSLAVATACPALGRFGLVFSNQKAHTPLECKRCGLPLQGLVCHCTCMLLAHCKQRHGDSRWTGRVASHDPAFLPPGCWAEASSPASDAAVGGRPPGMSPSCRAAGTPEASPPSAAGASGSVPCRSVCAPPAAADSAPTAAAALPPSWWAPVCSTPTAASARPLLDMLPASADAALLQASPDATLRSWLPLGILWTAPEGADMGRLLPESSGASRCAARSLMRNRLSLGTTAGLSPARAKATEILRVGMPRLPLSTPGSPPWKGCVGARTKLLPCLDLPALPGRSARQSRLAWNSLATLCCIPLLYAKLQLASHRHSVVRGDGLVLSGSAHTMGQVCSGHAC